MKNIGLMLAFFVFFGCVDKTKLEQTITLGINFKLLDNDTIKFYYILNEQDIYTEENAIKFNIKGSINFQNIEFKFEQIPKRFRIDLGENGLENNILISSINISNEMGSIFLSSKTIHRFFKPNIYALPLENGYQRIKVNNKYDPFLESTSLLHKKIELKLL